MSRNDQGEKGEHQRKQQHTAPTSDTHLGHIPALIAAFKMSKYLSNSHFCPNSICLRNSCLTHYWCVRFQHCYIPVSSAEKPLDLPLEIKSLGRKRTKKWESYTAFCLGALYHRVQDRVCVCVCVSFTGEVIDLFLLQQADGIIVSLQHELCLGVLGDHRLAAEIPLGLQGLLLLRACF